MCYLPQQSEDMMLRDIFTNKWILAAVSFLMLLSVACVFWYQHDIAPAKQEAAETAKLVREWETASNTDSETEQVADLTAADSTPQAAEKPVTQTKTEALKDVVMETHTQENVQTPDENAKATDEQVSPYGFGPYPKVPDDYPTKHLVKWPASSRGSELLSRVLIKLWTEGERDFYGGSTNNGRVYPHYNNTVYTRFGEYRQSNGEIVRYAQGGIAGPHVDFGSYDLLNPPSHLRVLDIETSGIDPYQFLNLPNQKGKKQ